MQRKPVDEELGDDHGAAAMRLGGADDEPSIDLGRGFPHVNSTAQEVEGGSAECDGFAPANSGVGKEPDQHPGTCLVVFGGLGEVGDLLGVEEELVAWPVGRDLDMGGGVLGEHAVGDGLFEGGAEDLAGLADP